MAEETMSTNFIHSIIEEELEPAGAVRGNRCTPGSRQSRTATSISDIARH